MTTTAAQIPGNPIKTLVQSPEPNANPTAVSEAPSHDSAKDSLKSPPSDGAKDQAKLDLPANGCGKDTDIQKKMKRAERFGTTLQLTEQEKRNTRAER